MKHLPSARLGRLGYSLGLLLTLGCACTEEKKPPTPQTPTTDPVSSVNAEARDYGQYTELVWSDEFDGGALNQSTWTYELGAGGWGNQELQTYTNTPANSFVTGGNFVIQVQKAGSDYTSARVITKGKRSFGYGRVDIRVKLPKGQGIWPAAWMMGSNYDQVNWPACGEIDIVEMRGRIPNVNVSTVHYGSSPATHQYKGTEITLPTGNFSDDFHLFSLIRSKDKIRWFLDGQLYYTITPADVTVYPFNNPFFVLLNVAVGGQFDDGRTPDASVTFPQQMLVDYVRHYQYK